MYSSICLISIFENYSCYLIQSFCIFCVFQNKKRLGNKNIFYVFLDFLILVFENRKTNKNQTNPIIVISSRINGLVLGIIITVANNLQYLISSFLGKKKVKALCFLPLAVHQLFVCISCHDCVSRHQCQRVEAEPFVLASKFSHSPRSGA